MLIDTHAHLNADQYDQDLEEVIGKARAEGVKEMIVVGFDEKTIRRAIQICEQHEGIYAAIGWHPVDAIDFKEEHLTLLSTLAKHPKVVALGEMGLDYYWDKSPKDVQISVFRQQIGLAKKVKLPIIIHNRDATEDIIRIMIEEGASEVGGIMHCFGGSIETANLCINQNFYLSIGGPVTFKNATKLQKVVEKIPLDKLLIETDCPYLTPHPYRGTRNEPSYMKLIAEKIAELKGCTFEEIALATTNNAKKLLKLG